MCLEIMGCGIPKKYVEKSIEILITSKNMSTQTNQEEISVKVMRPWRNIMKPPKIKNFLLPIFFKKKIKTGVAKNS